MPQAMTAAVLPLVFLAYVLAGKLGLKLAFVHASATAVWPPTGIALAALLVIGYRVWPAILLGAFVVNVTTSGAIVSSLAIAVGNTLEGLVAAYLVNRWANSLNVFERAPDTFRFVALAGGISPMVSATIGVTSLCLTGGAPWGDYGRIWATWWLGDAAGALLVAPPLMLWSRDPTVHWGGRRTIEAVLVGLSVIVTGLFVFGGGLLFEGLGNNPVAFLSIPPLVWAAFRFGPRTASTLTLGLAVIATWGTVRGFGPFAIEPPHEALLLLQGFMTTMAGMTLPVAAAVAERRRLRQGLELSEVAYRSMFVNNPHPMWVLDRENFRFLTVNDAAITQYGYSRAEFLAMTVFALRRPEEEPLIRASMRTLGQGRPVLRSHQHRTKDGRVFPVEITAHPLVFDGRPAALVLARDVTERTEAETERQRLLHRAEAARAEAEEANRTKDRFLATLSHELRTPLNAMLGWVTLLRSGRLDETATARALETIERNTRLQTKLIADLLDVSRIMSGKLSVEMRPVDLPAVIDAAVEAVRPDAAAKEIRLEIVDGGPAPVLGDAARLQQVVWNLLSNAVKFSERGGQVTVRLERRDPRVEVHVRDAGKGIDPDFLPHIFERFQQADVSSTRSHGGLGLGLAIVRHLVEIHGGSVRADSPGQGQGATFTIDLPLAPASAARALAQRPASLDAAPSLEGVSVLVVDDDADSRQVVSTILTKFGATATAVASARDALASLERAPYDVLVADIAMPEQDGYDLIREVRHSEGPGRRIPAVALTAYAGREDRTRALTSGYHAHLAKPVEAGRLAEVVAALARRGKER